MRPLLSNHILPSLSHELMEQDNAECDDDITNYTPGIISHYGRVSPV